MAHYFTACTTGELEATLADLRANGHQIVETHPAGTDVRMQNTDPDPRFCCGKQDAAGVVVVHSTR
jgi:hypothetical protein